MKSLKRAIKNKVIQAFQRRGYLVERLSYQQLKFYREYHARAEEVCQLHRQQTEEAIRALRKKYQKPVLGKVEVWDLLMMLGKCVDVGDRTLYCTSQLTHVMQMLAAMERDRISDPGLYLAALVHDLGKILLLTGEAPENVVGGHHKPIGEYEQGIGLDNCLLQWDHGEFAYQRLRDYLPDHIAWLVRYHAILPKDCEAVMDDRDRRYLETYFKPFNKYDFKTKSPYCLPKVDLEKYRDLIETTFPEPVLV